MHEGTRDGEGGAAHHESPPPAGERLGASAIDDGPYIGSHRDLNAHNVLFEADRLTLVDWDAAGPASARSERANYAILWSRTPSGDFDEGTATAFLRGYRDGGGTIDSGDPDVLASALRALIWWAQQNVTMAADSCSGAQDSLALALVRAVLDGPQEFAERRIFLSECLRRM